MKSIIRIRLLLSAVVLLLVGNALSAQDIGNRINSIVLVHGAWVDGSGWRGVYDILTKKGYNVSVVQEPETSFQADVTATKRILAQQNGPCNLVGHSYGGSVITEAGNDPVVVGLVYIAAHMPDKGESEAGDGKLFPSELSKSGAVKVTPDGYTYLDPAKFPYYFAPELPARQAQFMARSQVLNPATSFATKITKAAWRTKPSWMFVAGNDRVINPNLERWYAERAKCQQIEVAKGACHAVFASRPNQVAALIEAAATSVNKER
jgi:pimeloyl-ACP methyl ester carboxylesterase